MTYLAPASQHIERSLQYYLQRHFASAESVVTAEIGMGTYTDLFCKNAASHTCFLESGSDLALLSKFGSWEEASAAGPVIVVTDYSSKHEGEIPATYDLIFMGGSQTYPECAVELSFAISRLKPGGVLVLSGIDVPATSVNFDFLVEHPYFSLQFQMEETAFFGYAGAPASKPQSWWNQAFNSANYPVHRHDAYAILPATPQRFDLTGYHSRKGDVFRRGIRLQRGRVFSDGSVTRIDIPCRVAEGDEVEVSVDVCPVGFSERNLAAIELAVGASPRRSHAFESDAPVTLTLKGAAAAKGVIQLYLIHSGLVPAAGLEQPESEMPFFATPNVEILGIEVRPAGFEGKAPHLKQMQGAVSQFGFAGETFSFFVCDEHDSIQAHHHAGELYEVEELALIGRHMQPGARVLDIGANIGNHTVYFEKVLKASSIVVIELQPRVIDILKLNIALNGLRNVDQSFLGVGLGASEHNANMTIPQAFNVAGAQFAADASGGFRIVTGDKLLSHLRFDFIKLDVEGMECEVIEGLRETIARDQPAMFIEVWNENVPRFDALIEELGYEKADEWRRYDVAINFLVKPKKL